MVEHIKTEHGVDCETVPFNDFKSRINSTDIVITSTSSSEPILYEGDIQPGSKPVLLIDIAVPRDIDDAVANHEHIVLKNIDDLHSVLNKNHERRMRDVPVVKSMIMKEMSSFLMWYYSLPLMPDVRKNSKPDADTVEEMVKIKAFLNENLSEIHKLARSSGKHFKSDLKDHSSLIQKLVAKRREAISFGK